MVVGQHTAACVLSVVISAVRIVMMISKMRLMVRLVESVITFRKLDPDSPPWTPSPLPLVGGGWNDLWVMGIGRGIFV